MLRFSKRGLQIGSYLTLPGGRKVFTVTENAKYLSKLFEKSPTMNMKKKNTVYYMIKHRIEIKSPIPGKPVLLQKNREVNIPNKYVVDEII